MMRHESRAGKAEDNLLRPVVAVSPRIVVEVVAPCFHDSGQLLADASQGCQAEYERGIRVQVRWPSLGSQLVPDSSSKEPTVVVGKMAEYPILKTVVTENTPWSIT